MSEELLIESNDDNIIEEDTSTKIVEHIISIDFNYIMFPCIKLYHDLCRDKECPAINWRIIKDLRGITDNFLYYDNKAYHKIMDLVNTVMKSNDKCKLISTYHHSDILDKLPSYENNEVIYDLVNIDFYHDIVYNKNQKNLITSFQTYDSNTWVGNLLLNNKIDKYTWVKAPNSDLYDYRLTEGNDIKFNHMEDIKNMDYFDILKDCSLIWDYIVINFPEYQVPYEYKHLYDLIFELFQRKE